MSENLRSHTEVTLEYFRERPEELGDFLQISYEESEEDGDWEAFAFAIDIAVDVLGGKTKLARELGVSRTSLYKTLSKDGRPQLNTIERILRALGYHFRIEPIGTST